MFSELELHIDSPSQVAASSGDFQKLRTLKNKQNRLDLTNFLTNTYLASVESISFT